MTKEEIIEILKENIQEYLFQNEIDAYIKGYLDALRDSYEITWEEKIEILEVMKNE